MGSSLNATQVARICAKVTHFRADILRLLLRKSWGRLAFKHFLALTRASLHSAVKRPERARQLLGAGGASEALDHMMQLRREVFMAVEAPRSDKRTGLPRSLQLNS